MAGATGNQGGAVVDALIDGGGWHVRGLTRNASSEAAKALARRGVEVVEGELTDRAAVKRALHGAYGVFSVQQRGKQEIQQGVTLAEAAEEAGVSHFVYTSAGGVERVRGIPHFDTKWEIERHVRRMPYTILRPTTFMEAFTSTGASIGIGMMAAVLKREKKLQMIAVADIGSFARLAFENPDTYLGQELELAGDELTIPEVAATVGKRYWRLPPPVLHVFGKESRMIFWFGESGFRADIPALRKLHPGLLTLRRWSRG
ncbi:NmrA/HSCARG family protein [Nonomuraea sediminis]|uniref:NmrA/HSCARG family protein n=1 Tax=Nonomuraea sediminis TaxID=2835864 RepID=UPI001BDD6012|nr:NmrA/HSCARG family protein [Nonomuraea sediminis]